MIAKLTLLVNKYWRTSWNSLPAREILRRICWRDACFKAFITRSTSLSWKKFPDGISRHNLMVLTLVYLDSKYSSISVAQESMIVNFFNAFAFTTSWILHMSRSVWIANSLHQYPFTVNCCSWGHCNKWASISNIDSKHPTKLMSVKQWNSERQPRIVPASASSILSCITSKEDWNLSSVPADSKNKLAIQSLYAASYRNKVYYSVFILLNLINLDVIGNVYCLRLQMAPLNGVYLSVNPSLKAQTNTKGHFSTRIIFLEQYFIFSRSSIWGRFPCEEYLMISLDF